ncbi:MAG: hypothetical protein AAF502_25815, partial [Bacteroidota bacterium]
FELLCEEEKLHSQNLGNKVLCNQFTANVRWNFTRMLTDPELPDALPSSNSEIFNRNTINFQNDLPDIFSPEPSRPQPGGYAQTPTNWAPILSFSDSPVYQVGSLYGRAVGLLEIPIVPKELCSGWLSGGPYLITAEHCRADKKSVNTGRIPKSKRTAPITFGQYFDKMSQDKAIQDARNRLIDLGIPAKYVNSLSPKKLFKFETTIIDTSNRASEGWRDIDYHQITPKELSSALYDFGTPKKTYTLPTTPPSEEEVTILPSHIFGHIPLTSIENKHSIVNQSVYSLSINKDPAFGKIGGFTLPQALLSPNGRIYELTETTEPGKTFRCDAPSLLCDSAKSSYYIRGGSSGGAAMYLTGNIAIGVNSYISPKGVPYYAAFDLLPRKAFRYRLPLGKKFFSQESIDLYRKFQKEKTEFTKYQSSLKPGMIGKTNGTKRLLECQPGYAAAGIVASSISPNNTTSRNHNVGSGRIGNFGLICLPMFKKKAYTYSFSHAKVVASGSIDLSTFNDFRAVSKDDYLPFDIYINEYLTTNGPFGRNPSLQIFTNNVLYPSVYQQQFTMCAPGYYIKEIEFLTNEYNGKTLIESIQKLGCQSFDGKKFYKQPLRQPIGAAFLTLQSKKKVLSCPNGFIVDAAEVHSEQYANSIKFRCKKIP